MGEQSKKKKLIWLGTSHVSLVDYGANHGGNKHFFSLKGDTDLIKAREECSKKYGIEALEGDIIVIQDAPTYEALFGDPVNVKYVFGKADNKLDVDLIKQAMADFKKDVDTYTKDDSKARVYERIVRAALSEKIEVEYDSENPIDKLLPNELKDRLSKGEEGESDEGEKTPEDEEPAVKTDGQDTDWSVQMQVRLDALDWSERLRKLEQSAKSDPTPSEAGQDEEVAELKKRSEEAETREAELKKDNERIKAELGALKGKIGTSVAIRPGNSVSVETSEKDTEDETWPDDMGHPVPNNTGAPITR
jgi:hypothetical protein